MNRFSIAQSSIAVVIALLFVAPSASADDDGNINVNNLRQAVKAGVDTSDPGDHGTARPHTIDLDAEWTLVMKLPSILLSSECDLECLEQLANLTRLASQQASTPDCSTLGNLCLTQPDRGRIYENTRWDLMADSPNTIKPSRSATVEAAMVAGGCAALGAALYSPQAGAMCVMGGASFMAMSAASGSYDSVTEWSGYYRTAWTSFGWEEPLIGTGDPTTGRVASSQVAGLYRDTSFYAPNNNLHDEAKRKARLEAEGLAKTLEAMKASADASAKFKLVGGLVDLNPTSTGGLAGVTTSSDKTKVKMSFRGPATVPELAVLFFVDWDLFLETYV